MHTCTHANMHMCIHAYLHHITYIHTYIHHTSYIHAYKLTSLQAYMLTCLHAACMHACMHVCVSVYLYTYSDMYMYIYMHISLRMCESGFRGDRPHCYASRGSCSHGFFVQGWQNSMAVAPALFASCFMSMNDTCQLHRIFLTVCFARCAPRWTTRRFERLAMVWQPHCS